MEIIGYFASILIGISLGLIGGGGSTLTVPVLVYLFAVDAVAATTYSLFIVGTTSIVGSISYFKHNLVNLKIAVIFGIPSVLSVFLVRYFLLPTIPENMFSLGNFTLSKGTFLMAVFALLMLVSAYSMVRKTPFQNTATKKINYYLVVLQGLLVGFLTGLVGAGGGFLIIPALVQFLKLPIKTAIGTSLAIIVVNSLFGFLFSLSHIDMEWHLILPITAIASIGILIGSWLAYKIDGKKLKPAFGWFIIFMGIYILLKEFL